MTDLYGMMIDALKDRGCLYVEKFAVPYICSIGAHIFNLHNHRNKILFEAGRLYNSRVHIMFVAPPGYSKTFFQDQFLMADWGLLWGTPIKIGQEGYMTEAGWVGSVTQVNGEIVPIMGAAYHYREAIVGIEEFSALVVAMRAQHSSALDTAMLTSLDTGRVRKRLRGGPISYETQVTLWCATQPARFDLTSGLGRRFVFISFVPRRKDAEQLKYARRNAINIRPDIPTLNLVRSRVRAKLDEVENIKFVTFEEELYETLDKLKVEFFEEILYERIALGYNVMRFEGGKVLEVEVDKECERILRLEKMWRDEVKRGSEFALVLQVIREHGGTIDIGELREEMLRFGLDWSQSTSLVFSLVKVGVLGMKGGVVWVRGERCARHNLRPEKDMGRG